MSIFSKSVILFLFLHFTCLFAYSPFSSLEEKSALDMHNKVRRTLNPPAANIYMLSWNSKYQALAQQASNSCQFKHNYGGDYAGLGENIYMGSSDAENFVMAWWLEGENYDITDESCDTDNRKYPVYNTCGHYYQAARALVYQVGCARTKCDGSYLIFCEYNRNGKNPPYTIGPPCSSCPEDAQFCYQRMCVTAAQRATIGSSKTSCEVICKNCGTKVVSSSSCKCKCPSGFSGVDCSVKQNGAVLPGGCSTCHAKGTLCLHNAVESSTAGVCKCTCAFGYSGTYCEKINAEICNGIIVKFAGNDKKQTYYPVDYHMWPKLLDVIKVNLTASVNKICNSLEKFSDCCPNSGSWNGVTKSIVEVNDLVTAQTYPVALKSGGIQGILNYVVKSSNSLCSKGKSWMLSGSIIKAAYENVKSVFATPLKSCCGDYYMKVISFEMNNNTGAVCTATPPTSSTVSTPSTAASDTTTVKIVKKSSSRLCAQLLIYIVMFCEMFGVETLNILN